MMCCYLNVHFHGQKVKVHMRLEVELRAFYARSEICKKRLLGLSCPSVRPSVRPHRTTQLPLDGFSWYFIFEYFFENLSRKVKFHSNLTRIADTLHEDVHTFVITSRWILSMRNISDTNCRENRNTFYVQWCFSKSCRSWENVEKYCKAGQTTDDKMASTHCLLDN